jgi:hypothetical protein
VCRRVNQQLDLQKIAHIQERRQPPSIAMRFRLLNCSNLKSYFCARFHGMHSPSCSATIDNQMQRTSEYSNADRRLDIFLEQQMQPWNAPKLLEASIIVNVVLPDGVGVPTSLEFDARSPAPTPAHILSILPESVKSSPSLKNSAALGDFAPIAAAVNGRVIGLGDTCRCKEISKCGDLLLTLKQVMLWINLAGQDLLALHTYHSYD